MFEDAVISLVYIELILWLISLAGLMEWLTEKMPFLNRLMNRFLSNMMLTEYDREDDDL